MNILGVLAALCFTLAAAGVVAFLLILQLLTPDEDWRDRRAALDQEVNWGWLEELETK